MEDINSSIRSMVADAEMMDSELENKRDNKTRKDTELTTELEKQEAKKDKLKQKLHIKSKSGFEKFQEWSARNIYLAGGFTGGFFLGIASS